MKTSLRTAILAATALITLPALAEEAQPAKPSLKPTYADSATIINVNGEEIKGADLKDIWENLFAGQSAPDFSTFDEKVQQNVLRGIISERLVYGEAVKAGFEKKPEVQERIADLTKQVILQSYMEDKAKALVSEAEIKALYDKKAAEAKDEKEVKARHILVATEAEAKKISEQLKKGGDFETIAKEASTDKGSGANGGDLGWFGKDRMVKEFADAAFKLKKGEVSGPVKSPFGWHVIKVEDTRPVKFASFAEMKEPLQAELSNQHIQKYLEGLLKNAQITYYGPDGKEKPFSREIAPAAGHEGHAH
ncbi:MAG: peptidylprolyl isomerase [Alphaproteobacteria bacterium]